jgi:hypothetical protein
MYKVRHTSRFVSGISATGFWLGMTVGRMILGFVTGRIGENFAIIVSDRGLYESTSHSDLTSLILSRFT